ncbi:cation transport protein-domain-containing protein [Fusarium sp. MPI-SDFR-AT-0072]|nr:cation transport protein-domain-containing protein [Fusarium sp. MPI-SDFR-AT-0072]
MLDETRASVWARLKAVKPPFMSKKPHFNFISVHYTWIIGATLLASVIIYGAGRGRTSYVDSLMFASGANTQAGLNPIDVNLLNTFQQIVVYLFTITSNPITLHTSVVFLRLYWFEKRFQGWVTDARQRRATLSKAKTRSRSEAREAEEGVNGRHITVVPYQGRPPRITNDGILLDGNDVIQSQAIADDDDDENLPHKPPPVSSDESDTVSAGRSNSIELSPLEKPDQGFGDGREANEGQSRSQNAPTGIKFAETVKRSDGVDDDLTKFPQRRSHAEHIAILERQRNQDNEILRIPGPRETERGMGPRRLDNDDTQDGDDDINTIAMTRTVESRPDHATLDSRAPTGRRPTIVIAEPKRPLKHELTDDAKAVGGTLNALRMRKPRVFNRGQKEVHDDNESTMGRAFRTRTIDTIKSALSNDHTKDMPYLSYTPTMGRNSNFVGLTLEQREELGGIEYRSLRTLALILLSYFWGFQLIAVTFLLPFILHNEKYGRIVEGSAISRTWWGFWTANSAFNDLGLTLTPDSMNSFNTSEYVMMVMWFLIIIGNTGFPVMLRFVIWVLAQIVPKGTGLWEELRFLLDHPRRCFTLLFPSSANWWLFWILAALNAIDLLFFVVLDLNSGPVAELPVHTRIADGLFQAASTRTAGFSCFSLSDLHPAVPVLYMIMMYISIFPIAISIRRTNVYEEKSLGVYHNKKDEDEEESASALNYVGTHLRRQLSFDLWYVFVGFFFLAISEGESLKAKDFNLFDVLFEVISAYGTVGLSMGVPNVNASLCSQFTVVGKLIIVAMQIRGRHRGLPYGLDRAVLLPSEARFQKEAEENQPILVRTRTNASMGTTSGMEPPISPGLPGRRGSMGRIRERANSRIISQFLYPGPVIPSNEIHGHKRATSNNSNNLRDFPRFNTEPVFEEEKDDVPPLRAIESHSGGPRRAETNPMP